MCVASVCEAQIRFCVILVMSICLGIRIIRLFYTLWLQISAIPAVLLQNKVFSCRALNWRRWYNWEMKSICFTSTSTSMIILAQSSNKSQASNLFSPDHSPLAQFTRFRPKRGGVSCARNCVLPCRTRILYWLPLPLGNQYYHLKYQGMNFCGVSYLYVNVDYLTECLWTCCLCYLGRFKTLYFEWTYSLVFRWTKCCEAQLRLYVNFFLSSLKLFLRTK